MKKRIVEPSVEIVRFGISVVATSISCNCWDGVFNYGTDEDCPNLNLPTCNCKKNISDPSLGNCVVPSESKAAADPIPPTDFIPPTDSTT